MEILRRYSMEFITVEQFKEQPIEVQKVFLDWWNPSIGDIFSSDILIGIGVITSDKFNKEGYISLLTEGQLRRFIEGKLGGLNIYYDSGELCVEYESYRSAEGDCDVGEYKAECDDLLEGYWKVACIVAKEGLDEGKKHIKG
jgi:hypothetical protein